ncbi:hypothetical protein [Pseudomonas sp.]|uniref:hypothetical protein n=1 Tax=Pseudomonas sp. TaxID=306 RepID=UPI002731AB93|nr:hypothetical protein [Pseudomonas sp.]MDP2245234.1 hypothetical protein [Pseudomonas sp.]
MDTYQSSITTSDKIVLARASQIISLAGLIELINETVKWAPPASLKGRLYRISRFAIPTTIWQALRELESWGAGSITQSENQLYEYMIADAQILELIIFAIRRLLDDLAGREERDKSHIFPQSRRQLIEKKRHQHDSKYDSSFEPR